ncbi:MAG TPA: DUF2239 family protein [Variovorax sp.]|nr:DUF2239 family protein [Variovorax sp.]
MPSETPSDPFNAAPEQLSAFAGFQRIASGPAADVTAQLRAATLPPDTLLRVFDDATGSRLDLELRPQAEAAAAAPPAAPARSVGRPRLGVVAREITLLPRHWEWLNRQPGGASVALRRLVDEARHVHRERDALRAAREATYRVMTEMAGDLPGFEEAARALFAGDAAQFALRIELWPEDLKNYLRQLSTAAWTPSE